MTLLTDVNINILHKRLVLVNYSRKYEKLIEL